MHRWHDAARNDMLSQQTNGPACMSLRRRAAGQRRQPGLGLTVENRWRRRCWALLAGEHRIESFVHQFLTYAHDHRQVGVERLDNLRVPPARAALALIRLQQDARLENRLGWRFAPGDQVVQSFALACIELDYIFPGWHDRSAPSVESDRK